MAGILLTKNNGIILGPIARILGWIMNILFNFLNGAFGIQNIGLTIILFTVIIYLVMLPLTIKQQKFSKMSAKMNPELEAIRKKYQNKKDNASMMAMNEETQAIYAKYGVSATGSCVQLIIQMPILFALYRVIMNVPAYVDLVKNEFTVLADKIMAAPGGVQFMEELSTNGRMYLESKDFTQVNTIIDVLYKLQDTGNATWQMLIDKFPNLESLIVETQSSINHMNNFGVNIANTPWNIARSAISTGAYAMLVGAVLFPVLAAVTQWLNVKLMPQPNNNGNDAANSMASTMKTMNMMMPLMSAYFCCILPAGMGLYWIIGAVVRGVQQWAINKYLDSLDLDEVIKKNIEKNNRIREKKGLPPQKVSNIAKANLKSIDNNKKQEKTDEERRAAMEASTKYYENSEKKGTLASKAAMVAKYNEKNKK